MRFFFYGTLLDPELRALVLGPAAAARLWLRPASLPGWERRALIGQSYPMIVPSLGGAVDGLLAAGVSQIDRAALTRYEGDGYAVRSVTVDTTAGARAAWVFAPPVGRALPMLGGAWSFAQWCAGPREAFLAQLRRELEPAR
jgi:hypothetical protein